MKVTPFETYQSYLSMKSHFTNRKYDFFRYGGKSRATMASFNKRKDKYWFEKTSRKYSDEQIVDFLLANFVTTDNPKNLWIGEIINSGERTYADWVRRQQSISYLFKEESSKLLEEKRNGFYHCANCGAKLFSSKAKFDSGTGWPSFSEALPGAFKTKIDYSFGMKRIEYHCANCGAHHGHVFLDGPTATGKRFCNNGLCLIFVPEN